MDPAQGLPLQPNCAICNGPANPECPCESDRLQIAVRQAEQRAMEQKLAEIRDWVIAHARHHILQAFDRLTTARKSAHSAYLSSLPYYSIYMQYSGHPPLHPAALAQLQSQIGEAHAELKRGIDNDWRASVLRYPEVLDYFYSLVDLRLPSETSRAVAEPPFASAGYSDRGYERVSPISPSREGAATAPPTQSHVGSKKKSRRDRSGTSGTGPTVPPPPPPGAWPEPKPERPSGSRKRTDTYSTVGGRLKHQQPPPVPTPPIAEHGGGRTRQGSRGAGMPGGWFGI